MTHNRRDRSLSVFRMSEGARPPVAGEANSLRRLDLKTPGFLVRRESASSGFWSSLRVVFGRTKFSSLRSPVSLFRTAGPARSRFPGRPVGASLLLHGSFIFFVIYLPHMLSRDQHSVEPTVSSSRPPWVVRCHAGSSRSFRGPLTPTIPGRRFISRPRRPIFELRPKSNCPISSWGNNRTLQERRSIRAPQNLRRLLGKVPQRRLLPLLPRTPLRPG
jgi:hypothetical protein